MKMIAPGQRRTLDEARDKMLEVAKQHKVEIPAIDRENAFLIFVNCRGDVERTARAIGIDAVHLLRIVEEERWDTRVKRVLDLQASRSPADMERGINRAINLVQAHRFRLCAERVLNRLTSMNDDDLFEMCITTEVKKLKSGEEVITTRFSTRPFADLASALEKAHQMTYEALNDTSPERRQRKKETEGEEPATYQEIHAAIAGQMMEAPANTTRAKVFDIRLAEADEAAVKADAQATLAASQ